MFTSKALVWFISGLHFMKTVSSGSFKIIGKLLAILRDVANKADF